ncbi:MAG: hypothetical protein PVI95_00835, partial [Dehalococcoidia bacterium]
TGPFLRAPFMVLRRAFNHRVTLRADSKWMYSSAVRKCRTRRGVERTLEEREGSLAMQTKRKVSARASG